MVAVVLAMFPGLRPGHAADDALPPGMSGRPLSDSMADLMADSMTDGRAIYLDGLLDDLAAAPSAERAAAIEDMIWEAWQDSGSPSINILMERGVDALATGNLDQALGFFEQVVQLAPAYAEGWNKRATVFYLKNEYGRSISDVEQVLRLEPRHFGALSGLALMQIDLGDKKGALETYRRVLAVDPWLEGAKEAEAVLAIEVEGRGI